MINFTEDYPFRPPTVEFIISISSKHQLGRSYIICLDIRGDEWIPILLLEVILILIKLLGAKERAYSKAINLFNQSKIKFKNANRNPLDLFTEEVMRLLLEDARHKSH
jgi:ubiquitin-protein ligase